MQPIKLKFSYQVAANDMDYKRYKGIEKINEVINQAYSDTRGQHFLPYFSASLLPAYKNQIDEYFLQDMEPIFRFKIETVSFDITELKNGRTPLNYGQDGYEYKCELSIVSVEYTCIHILDTQNVMVCYNDFDKQIKFIPTANFKIIVQ